MDDFIQKCNFLTTSMLKILCFTNFCTLELIKNQTSDIVTLDIVHDSERLLIYFTINVISVMDRQNDVP